MYFKFIRAMRIDILAASVLLTCCILQLQAGAQSPEPSSERTRPGSTVVLGLARGDMLRFSAFNPGAGERGEPIRMQMKLFDAQGSLIAASAEVLIPPGEFRSVDFKRDDLPIAGDPGTGLLQVRTQALWGVRENIRLAVPTTLEVMESSTGTPRPRFIFIVEALP